MKIYRHFSIVLAAVLFVSVAARGEEPSAEPVPAFSDSMTTVVGIAVGCAVVGPSTCIWFTQGSNDELQTYRSRENMGIQLGYFPSYVLDLAESKAFQRFETSAFVGNVLVAVNHRRGVQEPNSFSSTSYRIAYSFDWRHVRPALGLGLRKNVNARNGDALELWFPLFANRSKLEDREFLLFLETLWVFGSDGLRPEIQGRFEVEMNSNFRLAAGIGYFPDYHNPEAEISVGPVLEF